MERKAEQVPKSNHPATRIRSILCFFQFFSRAIKKKKKKTLESSLAQQAEVAVYIKDASRSKQSSSIEKRERDVHPTAKTSI